MAWLIGNDLNTAVGELNVASVYIYIYILTYLSENKRLLFVTTSVPKTD